MMFASNDRVQHGPMNAEEATEAHCRRIMRRSPRLQSCDQAMEAFSTAVAASIEGEDILTAEYPRTFFVSNSGLLAGGRGLHKDFRFPPVAKA